MPRALWNPKVRYRTHTSPPNFPILSHTDPAHTVLYYLFKTHFNTISPSMHRSTKWSLSSRLHVFLFSPIRATCHTHLKFLDVIILIVLSEEYKSRRSSLWNFLQSCFTSSLSVQNTPLSAIFSNTLSLCSYPNMRDQVSHPYKTKGKNYSSVYLNLHVLRQQTGRQKILDRIPGIPWI